ncbi:DUF6602 domain-containing protein [Janthinobacterium sp. FW305-128]|uniref:DUF6602 domain-containing protein n=1 Tax=Janthinobacterium sp. FW305-128 TaxID=2775055 RepID=UPI001E3A5DF3|nr:DUF6602 domain-containing protein [Janthinobacterium sp. FW305-128]MCC7681066.1 hypothetical protein [Janthinobacterium sp. FW305-128]
MNQTFTALLKEKIELFKYSFSSSARQAFVHPETGKLFHPGEFGTYRESIFREFLKLCVPSRLEIGSGFLINSKGDVSTQADIVIYDRSAIPRVESNEHQRFFPVEGVCAIGEVKSRLSKAGLREALNKLARLKAIADHVSSTIPIFRDRTYNQHDFNREMLCYDQIFSFLVCESFDFDSTSLPSEVSTWYDSDVKNHHKHNMVLSIKDGLLLYVDEKNKTWMYPPSRYIPSKNRLLTPGDNEAIHFHYFVSYMFMSTTSTTILFPEMTEYMPSLVGGFNCDEQ